MGTNIKFYDTNKLDSTNTSYAFTSALTSNSGFLWDNDYKTKIESVGSDDLTPEILTFSFTSTVTIDAIHIGNHNCKAGDIQYSTNNGSTYNDFSTPIALSGETESYNIYTFNSVSGITDIRFRMNTTQTVDAEKFLGQFRAFELIYEMLTNPMDEDFEAVEDSRVNDLDGGGSAYVFFDSSYANTFVFDDASDAEIDQLEALKERVNPFYVFPGGGDTDKTQWGWRIKDMYYVSYVNPFAPKLKNNMLGAGTYIEVELREA